MSFSMSYEVLDESGMIIWKVDGHGQGLLAMADVSEPIIFGASSLNNLLLIVY